MVNEGNLTYMCCMPKFRLNIHVMLVNVAYCGLRQPCFPAQPPWTSLEAEAIHTGSSKEQKQDLSFHHHMDCMSADNDAVSTSHRTTDSNILS